MRDPSRPSSPLQMVVLALVYEEAMHPYRMHALIKERGKDQIANVAQRNSVYQAIRALLRAGLIAVRETEREERRPERTIYEITAQGRRTLWIWMNSMLSMPAREFPDFPAALSHVAAVEPEKLRPLLETRVAALERRRTELETPYPGLPRVFLLEAEYLATLVRAEIKWLRAVIADLRSKKLTWSEQMIRRIAQQFAGMSNAASEKTSRDSAPAPDSSPAARKKRTRSATSRRRRAGKDS